MDVFADEEKTDNTQPPSPSDRWIKEKLTKWVDYVHDVLSDPVTFEQLRSVVLEPNEAELVEYVYTYTGAEALLVIATAGDPDPVATASGAGKLHVVKHLLAEYTDRFPPTSTALVAALEVPHVNVVKYLLCENRAIGSCRALVLAVRLGDYEIVERVLAHMVVTPCGTDSNTMLVEAARAGHAGIVQLLLPDYAPIGAQVAAVEAAATLGHALVARRLVDNNGGLYLQGALHMAAHAGHIETFELLLRSCDFPDTSVLVAAAAQGQLDVVRAILDDGRIDPGAFNANALVAATRNGHQSVVDALSADPRTRDRTRVY